MQKLGDYFYEEHPKLLRVYYYRGHETARKIYHMLFWKAMEQQQNGLYLEKIRSFSEFDFDIYPAVPNWEGQQGKLGDFLQKYINSVKFYHNGPPESFWLDFLLPKIETFLTRSSSYAGILLALKSLDLFAYHEPWFYPTISSYRQTTTSEDKCELELKTLKNPLETAKVCDEPLSQKIEEACKVVCNEIKTYQSVMDKVTQLFEMSVEMSTNGKLSIAPLCQNKTIGSYTTCWDTIITERGVCYASRLGL